MTKDGIDKMHDQATAPFGFKKVSEGQKQGMVNEVFSAVASRYDQMNDLMSGGLHRLWKDDFITDLNPPRGHQPFKVLDVAGGTGDIAFRILNAGGSGCEVTIADINAEMLGEGRKRARSQQFAGTYEFAVTNAEKLAFPDKYFDAYTIAFGIRNVTQIDKALEEAYRVLKPGGRFMCLEFSHVDVPALEALYDAYSFTVVPAIGKVVTGDGHPYRYLVESIRTFPNQQNFANMITKAGFSRAKYTSLTAGIVAIHSGWRI
jgi:demethylmenaquinone methyltransferase/2-methoxy-6-polyprenyl-1,4-benzoquinol methylase